MTNTVLIELLKLLVIPTSVAALVISVKTFFDNKRENLILKTLSCVSDMFQDYKDAMHKINDALDCSKKLLVYLKDCESKGDFSGFNSVYYSDEYKVFRDVHYFFELLGTMLRHKGINRIIVWECFSFPLEFFMATKEIREIIKYKKCLPGYASNFIWLFLFYNSKREEIRSSNKTGISNIDDCWIINGKDQLFSRDLLKQYSCGYIYKEFGITNMSIK